MNAFDLVTQHYNRVTSSYTPYNVDPKVLYISKDILIEFISKFISNKCDNIQIKDGDICYLIGIKCIIKDPFPSYTIISFSHKN